MKSMLVGLVFFASMFAVAAVAPSATVRPKSDQRIWQTAMNPSAPLTWPWESGADSATVVLSNRLTGARSSCMIEKSGDEMYGAFAPPVVPGEEAFFAVELTLSAGGAEVARYAADVAYVNGVAGQAIDVQNPAEKAWRRVPKAKLSTYDSQWLDATTNAVAATLAVNDGAATALSGTSGYLVLKSSVPGDVRFDLGFDEDPDVWTALLRCGVSGLLLLLK